MIMHVFINFNLLYYFKKYTYKINMLKKSHIWFFFFFFSNFYSYWWNILSFDLSFNRNFFNLMRFNTNRFNNFLCIAIKSLIIWFRFISFSLFIIILTILIINCGDWLSFSCNRVFFFQSLILDFWISRGYFRHFICWFFEI